MRRKKWPFVYVGIITAITYIPIVLTVIYSFNASKISSVWGGFSLDWYGELLRDRDIREALMNSLLLAFLSCLCASVIGTMGAVGMHRKKSMANETVALFSMLPIMIPEIILGMVFLSVFSLMDLPYGFLHSLYLFHGKYQTGGNGPVAGGGGAGPWRIQIPGLLGRDVSGNPAGNPLRCHAVFCHVL